jgi:hypothetical protein
MNVDDVYISIGGIKIQPTDERDICKGISPNALEGYEPDPNHPGYFRETDAHIDLRLEEARRRFELRF